MNKALNRLTYLFFFLLFFILTPILTMYALGYRYNFDNRAIEKNGAFYVKSYPSGAKISIDQKTIKQKTPTQIINIKPGDHLLTVEKDNYVPWQKKLNIHSGETTFAEDIVLFLDEREKVYLHSGSEEYLINKEKNQYAYFDNDNILNITDIEQNKNFNIFEFDKKYTLVDWSPNNQNLLLSNNNYYYLFNINQKNLKIINIQNINKIIWDDNNNDLLWFLQNKKLFTYDISQPESTAKQPKNLNYLINDFALQNHYLLIHYSLEKQNHLQQMNKETLEIVQEIKNVNLGNLNILKTDNQQLIFTIGSQFYLSEINKKLINIPFTTAELHDKRLLISNGYEITLYHFEDDWQELIDRSSQIIADVLWHPNGSYFISEKNSETYIIEIDGRDKRNMIKLLDNPSKKMYLFNKKGDKLFILTPKENFYLTIQ